MLDIFSRYSLGWLVVDQESALVVRSWIEQVVAAQGGIPPGSLTIHSDSEYVVAGSFGWSDPHSDRREKMRKDQLPPVA